MDGISFSSDTSPGISLAIIYSDAQSMTVSVVNILTSSSIAATPCAFTLGHYNFNNVYCGYEEGTVQHSELFYIQTIIEKMIHYRQKDELFSHNILIKQEHNVQH